MATVNKLRAKKIGTNINMACGLGTWVSISVSCMRDQNCKRMLPAHFVLETKPDEVRVQNLFKARIVAGDDY